LRRAIINKRRRKEKQNKRRRKEKQNTRSRKRTQKRIRGEEQSRRIEEEYIDYTPFCRQKASSRNKRQRIVNGIKRDQGCLILIS
jgi:hypothetical protein